MVRLLIAPRLFYRPTVNQRIDEADHRHYDDQENGLVQLELNVVHSTRIPRPTASAVNHINSPAQSGLFLLEIHGYFLDADASGAVVH